MSINKKPVTLSWEGEEYIIPMTYGLIDVLENEIELMDLYLCFTKGNIKYAKACMLLVIMLNSVGCTVTWDEMWDEVFSPTARGLHGSKFVSLLWEIFGVMFIPSKKKSEEVEPKKPVKNTRGKKSLKS